MAQTPDTRLSLKQELFCKHYTTDAKGVASEAMRLAGYADSYARAYCASILENVGIQARLKALASPVDSLLTHTRELALKRLWEALEAIPKTDYRGISALTDQLAKYQGWHAPTKYEDTSEARDLTESIRVKQLEAHIEQLLIQIKQFKSIIEVGNQSVEGEHERSHDQAVAV